MLVLCEANMKIKRYVLNVPFGFFLKSGANKTKNGCDLADYLLKWSVDEFQS